MENNTYHLMIHCKKGRGVLVQLTRALEALNFEIVNANLTAISDHILNTVVIKVCIMYLLHYIIACENFEMFSICIVFTIFI